MSTYNTPYKSGTISSFSGNETTVAGFTPAASDVGRIIVITSGSGSLQHREIISVLGQVLTLGHSWDTSPFLDVTTDLRASDVDPSNGDSIAISYSMDDLIATDSDITQTDTNHLNIAGLVLSNNAYIHSKGYNIQWDSSTIEITGSTGVIFGYYNYVDGEDAYVRNSCQIVDTHTSSSGDPLRGATFGMFDMYGGSIKINSGFPFLKFYNNTSSPTTNQTRLININVFGNMGSRVDGNRSMILATVTDSESSNGLVNVLTAVARVEISALNSRQAGYIHLAYGPTGRTVFKRLVDINTKCFRITNTTPATGLVYEVIGKKSEIDQVALFAVVDHDDPSHTTRYGNLIKPTFVDLNGSLITEDLKTVLFDANLTIVNTDTSNGTYAEYFARHTDIPSSIGNKTLASGTLYAPYSLRGMTFGKSITSSAISLEDTYDPAIVYLDEALLTETSKATIDAYTSIDDAEEFFDSFYSEQYDNFLTDGDSQLWFSRLANQIVLGSKDLVINATAVPVRDYTGTTATIKSSTFTGGATATTGDVTIQNGALLNGGTFNCDVNIDNNSEADTYTNVTIDKLIHTGTGTRTLTLDGGTITELEVTGGADLTVSLLNGATVTTTTETSGTITVSQDVIISDAMIIDGSRVQLWNVTKDAELDNSLVSGGGGYSLTINLGGSSIDDGDTIRIRTTYQSGVTAKLGAEALGIVTSTGLSFLLEQQDDTIYNTIGLDGSLITKFTADYINDEVDIVTASDFLGTELYARFVYFETTEDGIRQFFGGFMAVDIANYLNDVSVLDLYINNNTATNLKQTDNVRLYKSNGVYPVRNPTTGGGGVDVVWRSQVYVAETGVSGLTASESAKLLSLDTDPVNGLIEDVSGDRFTSKALEQAPSGGGSGLTAQQTRDAMKLAPSAGLGATDSIDEKLDAIEAQIPTVQNIVDGVLDEVIDNSNHTVPKSLAKRVRQAGTSLAVEGSIDDPTPTTASFITDLTQTESSFYADQTCIFVSGDLEGQARIITSYNATTKVLTFDEPWTIAPSDTDEFEIKADHVHPVSQIQSGLAKTSELFNPAIDEVITDSASRTASKAEVGLLALEATSQDILTDTNELQTNQGDWLTATGFNTIVPPTLTQMTSAFTEIKGVGWTTETLKDIRDNSGTTLTAQQIWEYATRELTDIDLSALETSIQADAKHAAQLAQHGATQTLATTIAGATEVKLDEIVAQDIVDKAEVIAEVGNTQTQITNLENISIADIEASKVFLKTDYIP